jgi:hypothetical protein
MYCCVWPMRGSESKVEREEREEESQAGKSQAGK